MLAALLVGTAGTGLLLAGHPASGYVDAPATAPGTLPANPLPPPWNVAPPAVPADTSPILRDLHIIARTVTCMVDGELVKNILTERAQEKAFTVDPRDPWVGGDNWDYNHEPFQRTKQTLSRATCLAAGTVGCTLYMPAPANPRKWHLLLNTAFGARQMMAGADLIAADPDPELLQVFHTGRRVAVTKVAENYSVLTPVYDSMGQVVAVVEVCTRTSAYEKTRQ